MVIVVQNKGDIFNAIGSGLSRATSRLIIVSPINDYILKPEANLGHIRVPEVLIEENRNNEELCLFSFSQVPSFFIQCVPSLSSDSITR